jgi:hypothetical protein
MPLAGNVTTRTVQGTFVTYSGTPASGSVSFTISSVLTNAGANQIIVPSTITATLDGSGSFSVQLVATNDPDLSPGFTYTVTENIGTSRRTFSLAIPESSPDPLDYATVAPATSSSENYITLVYRSAWDPLETRTTTVETGLAALNQTAMTASVNASVATVNSATSAAYSSIAPAVDTATLQTLMMGA